MRSEREMMELILKTAREDDGVRAALLTGSRANPNAPRDLFQDYDIIFIVEELEEFVRGYRYNRVFGTPLMTQMPELMRCPLGDGRFTYLTLYEDGCRVDLQLYPRKLWRSLLEEDSQMIPLLDKDGLLPLFPPASDKTYHTPRPALLDYTSCCNNFWWCMQNVAKGIWREELPYAMEMLHGVVREELNSMAAWVIGVRNNFAVSPGKCGKYLKRYLTPEEYLRYEQTYSGPAAKDVWEAVFQMCGLFEDLARQVGRWFRFPYPEEDAGAMHDYLKSVQALPPDAASWNPTIKSEEEAKEKEPCNTFPRW